MDDVQRAIDDQFKDVVDPDYENDVLKERVTVLQGGKYIMSFKKKVDAKKFEFSGLLWTK